MSRISFSPLDTEHRETLRLALEAAGLPSADIDEPDRLFFELADDQGLIGFIGLEGSGPNRLLRSLVVLPGRKRQGHGGLLVAHLEAFARQNEVGRLHLLTTSVADFFRARGYHSGDRSAAPAAVTGTAQFSTLCPASAAYLTKDLT